MKKFIVAIIITAAIASVAGYALGYPLGYSRGGQAVTDSYAAKIAALSKLFPLPSEIHSLGGRVKSVNATGLAFETVPVTQNPFAESFPAVREVAVTGATKITRTENKSPAVFQAEMAAYQKQVRNNAVPTGIAGTAPPVILPPPEPFGEINIKLSDIKTGDTVTVTADKDILRAASFSATRIQVAPASPKI